MIPIELSRGSDAGEIGGKAANLSRLLRAGYPVPNGFVLPTTVLRQFIADHTLAPDLTQLISGYAQNTRLQNQSSFLSFCQRVETLPVSTRLFEPINQAFLTLLSSAPHTGLAVRSSFISEDSDQASFAGVFMTHLAVTSLDSFWHWVKQCWCSAWSPQAAAYAARRGQTLPQDGMAVLVQPVIAARCSGVLFTADPVSGNPWRFILNAVPGLGQHLVDGTAASDRFVLAWDNAEVQEFRIADKPGVLQVKEGLICEEIVPPDQAALPALNPDLAQEVARMGLAIDRLFDRRMDIEWAVDDQQLWILQARPITALPPFFPHQLSADEQAETWTPYLNSYGNLHPGERLVAPMAWDRWESQLWRQFIEPGDIFPHLLHQERDFNGYRYATPRRWETGDPTDPGRIEAWLIEHEPRIRQNWLAQLKRVRQVNAALDRAFNQDHTPVQWARLLVNYAREERLMQAHVWYAPQWVGFTCEYLLKDFLKLFLPDQPVEIILPGLLQGLSCYSAERAAAAQDLGKRINEPPVLAAFSSLPLSDVVSHLRQFHPRCRFLVDLIDFCLKFGVEPPVETQPRPTGQDIDGLLLVIRNSLLRTDSRDAREALACSGKLRKTVENEVRSLLLSRQPDQLPRFDRLLTWAHFWVPALDNRKWHCSMTISLRWGRLLTAAGTAMTAAGLINTPEHIQMLTLDEWSAFADSPDHQKIRLLYQQRLHNYERNRRLEPLPYLGAPPGAATALGDEPVSTQPEPQKTLPDSNTFTFIGQGLAPGVARGTIRIITNLDAENAIDLLTSGDILVCGPDSFTAEWRRDYYALFLVVGGMVAVQGAQLHHATQIARECSVPLINLPLSELEQLPAGAMVEIDGLTGTVTLLNCMEGDELP